MPLVPLKLENGLQPYAWGSPSSLAEFLGHANPDGRPQAELWMGAHPLLPSRAVMPGGTIGLDALIREAPDAVLGLEVVRRFGPQLPFLFKVLAIAAPLSIQVHPDLEQARAGFARENAAGLPRDAPQRNYRDANHKPELIVALSRLTALKGFRPIDETLARLAHLPVPALASIVDGLRRQGPTGLRAFFSALLSLPEAERLSIASLAAAEASERASTDLAWDWVGRLARRYPQDVGVLAPLYLNLVLLEPGEGLFLPAGELHAYLDGMGVEIMASSDNVLRGGLTPKHVDAPELLRLLTFEAGRPEVLTPKGQADGALVFPTPAAEFELAFLRIEPTSRHGVAGDHGIEILLGLDGRAELGCGDAALPLARGDAVLVPAAAGDYAIEGEARIARARVPRGR